jgi:hypothetical protein
MKRIVVMVTLAVVTLAGFAIFDSASPRRGNAATGNPPLVVVLLENKSYLRIIGSASAPYLNGTFLPQARIFTNYFAIEHPSLPNYLDIVSGSDQGCRKDGCPRATYDVPSLFSQLTAAGISWKAYNESMPSNCALKSKGKYAPKHNPAVYFTTTTDCATNDVPGIPDAATLPAFSFVTPNLCSDMHGTGGCRNPTKHGDDWLAAHIDPLVAAGTEVVIVFDEGKPQNVLCAVVGPGIAPESIATALNHYGLLGGIETYFGLSKLGNAATATEVPL